MYINSERQRLLGLEWWTPVDLAEFIGVRSQRIYAILAREPGRIVGASYSRGRWYLPVAPRIKRAERERPGPLLDYIDWWYSSQFVFADNGADKVPA